MYLALWLVLSLLREVVTDRMPVTYFSKRQLHGFLYKSYISFVRGGLVGLLRPRFQLAYRLRRVL